MEAASKESKIRKFFRLLVLEGTLMIVGLPFGYAAGLSCQDKVKEKIFPNAN